MLIAIELAFEPNSKFGGSVICKIKYFFNPTKLTFEKRLAKFKVITNNNANRTVDWYTLYIKIVNTDFSITFYDNLHLVADHQ